MTRFYLLIILFSSLPLAMADIAMTQEFGVITPLSQITGEDHSYGIDFLFFTRLAEGELRLVATKEANVLRAELIGRTLGIASWLAGERTQTYRSLMRIMPDGSLNSIEHESEITKKRWGQWTNRGKIRRFDYERRKITEVRLKEGVVSSSKELDIPGGKHPVDLLTAFYNLRSGVYGPLQRGTRILIPTYSGKGFIDFEVNVLTREEQARQHDFPDHGLLIQVNVDPEIFDTKSGSLYVWFDDLGVPGRGIVEDMIGLGDVRGYLDKEGT
ncbi:MAG: DUF3108 domain-containing protein [Desulfuromonadales bacterium]|jgi:hypothetical protein